MAKTRAHMFGSYLHSMCPFLPAISASSPPLPRIPSHLHSLTFPSIPTPFRLRKEARRSQKRKGRRTRTCPTSLPRARFGCRKLRVIP